MKISILLMLLSLCACSFMPTSSSREFKILALNPNVESSSTKPLVENQKFEKLIQTIRFNANSVDLNTSSQNALAEIAKEIINSEYPFDVIKIHGLQASSEKTNDLSQKRADTVRQYLIKNGVQPEKLEDIGKGHASLDTDLTPVEEARDRRVDFEIVENTESQAL